MRPAPLESLLRLGGRALARVLGNPAQAQRLGAAVGAVQRGKRRFEAAQADTLHLLGFAHRGDYREIEKRLNGTRRRARALLERASRLVDTGSEHG